MPEDSKKNDKKNAKEQRKPRQRNQQRNEKKPEKAEEPSRSAPKVVVPQKPPVYESPPPEFFQNLKRETDEILKITEEENTKYKKKEIQSNWSKYEMPIESYEEIDEQENLGADYEKLIEAPLSVGGHFQFKHEKTWDLNTGPSQYDKYFEIDMDDLNTALCTVPFYERNNIEQSLFTETDILTMTNRSTRFKQKYFNDKSYSTPETETQEKILNSLRDSLKNDNSSRDVESNDVEIKQTDDISFSSVTEDKIKQEEKPITNISLEFKPEPVETKIDTNKITEENILNVNSTVKLEVVEHDDFIFGKTEKPAEVEKSEASVSPIDNKPKVIEAKIETPLVAETKVTAAPITVAEPPQTKKNPVIESPEDLEKWLDDFLDG